MQMHSSVQREIFELECMSSSPLAYALNYSLYERMNSIKFMGCVMESV